MIKKRPQLRLVYLTSVDGKIYAYKRWHGRGSKRMAIVGESIRYHVFIDPTPFQMLKGENIMFYTP